MTTWASASSTESLQQLDEGCVSSWSAKCRRAYGLHVLAELTFTG